MEDKEGNMRYLTGEFKDYEKAKEFKHQMIEKYNLKDCFLIAEKNGDFKPVKEVLNMH